jgi:hypothetical protein
MASTPQSVLNYFKGFTPYGEWPHPSLQFTDENGYVWIPDWEGASPGGDSAVPTSGSLRGYRRGLNPGDLPGQAKGTDAYFSPSGQYQYTNTDDVGWLNPVTGVLAVASLGTAAYLAAGAGMIPSAAAAEGAAAGAGAGAGAGVGAGAVDLGGGLTMAADGSIVGTTFAGGGTLTNAEIAAMASGAGYGGSGALGAGAGLEGVSPPANPYATPGGTPPPANPYTSGWQNMLSNGVQNMGASDWMGLATTALGAYGGSQGTGGEQTTQNRMDPRMDPYVYGSLLPNAQGLMNAQMPIAGQNSAQLTSVGRGLLNTPVNPNLQDNPYMTGVADDMQRRTGSLLGTGLQQIQGNAVGVGGLGGTRQGVAQGEAMKGAADSLQGNLSNLYYNQYNADANRNLAKITLGSGLMSQGQQAPWAPLQSASDIYRPYTGLNSSQTTSSQQGGGLMGALGGGLAAAQFAKNAGWW